MDNLSVLHHPDNVLLTKLCLLKHKDGASALAMLKHVFLLAKAARRKPPVVVYLPEQAEEMEVFERFADNATMIRRTSPHRLATKMKVASVPGYQELFDEVIAPQFKTGVWCGFTIRMPFIPQELYSNAIPEITVNGVRFTFWTMEERLELVDDIEQAEAPFNPHHLKIPRNPDGSPNLTGGKCPLFGFRLVADIGHFQSYSVGRARFRYNDDHQVIGDVVAAEKLATGCTTLRPTDLAVHYR